MMMPCHKTFLALGCLLGLAFGQCVSAQSLTPGVDRNTSQKGGDDNECAIAKNPNNANQLFYFCNTDTAGLFAARSTDGGGTWIYPDATDKTIADGDAGQGPAACCDPTASWDSVNKQIVNSCANPANYTCSQPGWNMSPRVVAVPVFDLELYLATGGPGNGTVKIVNILGFFVDNYEAGRVTGYLINKKGSYNAGAPGVAGPTSFLKQVILIR